MRGDRLNRRPFIFSWQAVIVDPLAEAKVIYHHLTDDGSRLVWYQDEE
jgi:hypothetical protein